MVSPNTFPKSNILIISPNAPPIAIIAKIGPAFSMDDSNNWFVLIFSTFSKRLIESKIPTKRAIIGSPKKLVNFKIVSGKMVGFKRIIDFSEISAIGIMIGKNDEHCVKLTATHI